MIAIPVLPEVIDSPSRARGIDRATLASDMCGMALEAGVVPCPDAGVIDGAPLPARGVHAAAPGGVIENTVYIHVGVTGVGIDGDVAARARRAPALQFPRGLGRAEQPAGG